MATASGESCEPTAMERFGSGGKALLPWTKQLLTVLWEQLRLLVHIIYYTFVSVFQMFRFEVHLRITDETGQHIQHMSSAANPSDSFLFSSLFDGDGGVMVGGSGTLSNFCADVAGKTPAEALLSSLRADDLCCGLVDDFVTRDGGGGGGGGSGVFLGHLPADWKVFVSGGDHSCGDAKSREESASGPDWSSEEEQSAAEFDGEDSKALWESLSSSNDPYNPFFFSACISTRADMGRSKGEASDGGVDLQLMAPAAGLVRRSDSESSWSSWASDGSGADAEESERLLELFRSPDDPYNPMCFTACTFSAGAPPDAAQDQDQDWDWDQDEEERLWSSLGRSDDPYHPLNFQAAPTSRKVPATPPKRRPSLTPQKKKKQQLRSSSESDVTLVPWRRAGTAPRTPPPSPPERTVGQEGSPKKVRFSPVVQVHVMRSWLFARQACRKGPWEEMARDRDRFQRRITDTERAIAHCLSPDHRERVWAEHLDSSQDEDL